MCIVAGGGGVVCITAGVLRIQSEMLSPMELLLQVCWELTDVELGTKLRSSGRIVSALSHWAISPDPCF